MNGFRRTAARTALVLLLALGGVACNGDGDGVESDVETQPTDPLQAPTE